MIGGGAVAIGSTCGVGSTLMGGGAVGTTGATLRGGGAAAIWSTTGGDGSTLIGGGADERGAFRLGGACCTGGRRSIIRFFSSVMARALLSGV